MPAHNEISILLAFFLPFPLFILTQHTAHSSINNLNLDTPWYIPVFAPNFLNISIFSRDDPENIQVPVFLYLVLCTHPIPP